MWSFHVIVLQRRTNKCTENVKRTCRAIVFSALNLLLCGVVVAVAVVVAQGPYYLERCNAILSKCTYVNSTGKYVRRVRRTHTLKTLTLTLNPLKHFETKMKFLLFTRLFIKYY